MPWLGVRLGPRRRKVSEADILEMLMTTGWAPEAVLTRRAEIEPEARAVLERFVGLGMGFERGADGQRLFDPAELSNMTSWAHLERGDPFWSENCLTLARAVVFAAHGLTSPPAGPPPTPAALPPRRFHVRFRRTFDLKDREPGTQIRLRLPLPIEGAALRDLSIVYEPAAGVRLAPAEGRLDVRLAVPVDGEVELGYEAAFTAYPATGRAADARLDPEDAALYTRPREGMILVDDAARALADELAGDVTEPERMLERFWRGVMQRLRFGVVNYEDINKERPWSWLLDNGWSDCQLGAALIASLCRAKNIPARLLSGYVLHPESPFHHFWLEVWLDGRGWTPLDTVCWGLSRGGLDAPWRDYFFGEVDYRMTTERLPHVFNGAGAVRFPEAVLRLPKLVDGGLRSSYYDADTGALVYADTVAVLEIDGAAV